MNPSKRPISPPFIYKIILEMLSIKGILLLLKDQWEALDKLVHIGKQIDFPAEQVKVLLKKTGTFTEHEIGLIAHLGVISQRLGRDPELVAYMKEAEILRDKMNAAKN